MKTILGIETSCDETAAAVVAMTDDGSPSVLSNVVASQVADHAEFGGVVPEIAARAHVELLDVAIGRALEESDTQIGELDGIAATAGPGLIGGLIVGTMTAKAIAAASGKPFIPVNHLEGHALTARLTDGLAFPYLLLLVSGGHTQIVLVEGVGRYRRWGSTIDDALGEAFDKTAKLLGLAYPGGPNVERAAMSGDAGRFAFPRPLSGSDRLDFSFSGLKTAVRQAATELAPLDDGDVADICASFQQAVTETLRERVGRGLARFLREDHGHDDNDHDQEQDFEEDHEQRPNCHAQAKYAKRAPPRTEVQLICPQPKQDPDGWHDQQQRQQGKDQPGEDSDVQSDNCDADPQRDTQHKVEGEASSCRAEARSAKAGQAARPPSTGAREWPAARCCRADGAADRGR